MSPLARYGLCALLVQLTSSVALVAAIVLDSLVGIAGRLELSTESGCLVLLAVSLVSSRRSG
jgi:hypothetical protein